MINRIIFPLALIKIINILGRNFSCFYCEKCVHPNTGYAYCPKNYERCYTGYRENSVFRGCASKKCIPISFTSDDDYSIIECCFEPFCNHWNLTFPVNGLQNDLVDSLMVDFFETTEKQRLYGYRHRSESISKTATTESNEHVDDIPQLLESDIKYDSANHTPLSSQNATTFSISNISTVGTFNDSVYLPLFELPIVKQEVHKQDMSSTNASAIETLQIRHTVTQMNTDTDKQTDAETDRFHTTKLIESEKENTAMKSDVAEEHAEKKAVDDELSINHTPETSSVTHKNVVVVQVADNSDSSNGNDDEEDDDVEKKKPKPAPESSARLRAEWKVFQRFHPKQDDGGDGAIIYGLNVPMLLLLGGLFL